MKTKDIICLFGGSCKVARLLGVKSQAVSIWIRKNSIPLKRIPSLEKIAKEKGLPIRAENMRPDIEWKILREGA